MSTYMWIMLIFVLVALIWTIVDLIRDVRDMDYELRMVRIGQAKLKKRLDMVLEMLEEDVNE